MKHKHPKLIRKKLREIAKMHDQIGEEMIHTLAQEITIEIDKEIIDNIRKMCGVV